MFDMREPTSEDYKKFAPALYYAEKHEKAHDGYYMIVSFDGVEKLLQVIDHRCFLYSLSFDKEVTSIEFLLDEEYGLDFVAISKDYVVSLEKKDEDRTKDEFVFVNNNNGNVEEFDFKATGRKDPDGYDGYATYVQYDRQKDVRVMMIFQHMVKPENRVYGYHLNNPAFVLIDRNINKGRYKRERFVKKRFNYEENPISYTLATMKDNGIFNTLNEGAVNINMMAEFNRYYRIIRETDTEIKIGFPFGRQYTLEEINAYVQKMGFNTSVPEEIIEFFNGDNREFKEVFMVSDYLRKLYEYTSSMLKQLNFGKDDNDGNN